jgi:hypothetical protein
MAYVDRHYDYYDRADDSLKVKTPGGVLRWWPLFALAVLSVLLFAFTHPERPNPGTGNTPPIATTPMNPAPPAGAQPTQ